MSDLLESIIAQSDLDSEIEDFLEHWGVRGMHWGIRSGKKKTGVSRTRGATLDRNQRATQRQIRRQAGKGGFRDRISQNVLKVTAGKKRAQKYRNFRLSYLKKQRARTKAGETNVLDKLQTLGNFTVTGLFVSRTTGHQGLLSNKFGKPTIKKK